MNNHPNEHLFAEHDVISGVEVLVPLLDGYWNINSEIYEEAIRSLLTFFREYADNFHHYKEEQVLFPKMNRHPDFSQHELIAELEDHHVLFRGYLSSVETSLQEKNYEKVQTILRTYVNELLDHIGAENDELFVMAETLFSEAEMEAIYFAFKDVDRELGEEKKQRLAETIQTIENILSP